MPCLNETIPTERGMGRLTGGIGFCLLGAILRLCDYETLRLCDCDGMQTERSGAEQMCESPPGKCRAGGRRRISANDSVFGDGETSSIGVTATSPSACVSQKERSTNSQLSRGSRGRRCGRRPGATFGGLSLCVSAPFGLSHAAGWVAREPGD